MHCHDLTVPFTILKVMGDRKHSVTVPQLGWQTGATWGRYSVKGKKRGEEAVLREGARKLPGNACLFPKFGEAEGETLPLFFQPQ